MISIMKNYKTIIRKNHTQQLHFITKLLDIKDLIIFRFMEAINLDIRKEISWDFSRQEQSQIFSNYQQKRLLRTLTILKKRILFSLNIKLERTIVLSSFIFNQLLLTKIQKTKYQFFSTLDIIRFFDSKDLSSISNN